MVESESLTPIFLFLPTPPEGHGRVPQTVFVQGLVRWAIAI
jgi:hypothetical protein